MELEQDIHTFRIVISTLLLVCMNGGKNNQIVYVKNDYESHSKDSQVKSVSVRQ